MANSKYLLAKEKKSGLKIQRCKEGPKSLPRVRNMDRYIYRVWCHGELGKAEVGEIIEEIDFVEEKGKRLTPNVVMVPLGPESDLNDAETTSIKSIFQNFVTSIKFTMRILSSGQDDCAADVFVDFLKQPDVGQVVNEFVRVTSVVTEEFLEKNGYYISETGEENKLLEFNKSKNSPKAEEVTFETFFHDLIIIDNQLNPEKVIEQMTICYQEKSVRDLKEVKMKESYPVDFKGLLVCVVLTDKLEEANKVAKKFHASKIPAISLMTASAMESKEVSADKNVTEEALDPLMYLSKDLKFNQKLNLVKSTNLDHFVKLLEQEIIVQGILGREKKDALAVYLIARFCDKYPEEDNELCTLIQQCSQEELEKAFITAVRSQRFWFVDLVARQKDKLNEMLTLDFLEVLFDEGKESSFAQSIGTTGVGKRAKKRMEKEKNKDEKYKSVRKLCLSLRYILGKQVYEPYLDSLPDYKKGNIEFYPQEFVDYLFLYSLVNMQPESIDYYWKRSTLGLGGTVAAAQIMKFVVDSEKSFSWNDRLAARQQKEKFEKMALELLRECSIVSKGLHDLSKAVKINPVSFMGNYHMPTLEIVTKMEFKEFVTEDACQEVLTHDWYHPLAVDNSALHILLCCILPFFSFTLKFNSSGGPGDSEGSKVSMNTTTQGNKKMDRKQSVGFFFKAMKYSMIDCPLVKFFYFGVANIIFLMVFSYFILFEYQPVFDWKKSYLEYLIWFWQIVLFMEEIYQLSKIAGVSFGERVNMYVDSYWNKIDITGCLSLVAAIALRLLGSYYKQYNNAAQVAKSCYALSLLMAFAKVLYTLSLNQKLGPKVQMVRDMLIDTTVFLMLLIVVLLGFGVTLEYLLIQDFSGRLPAHHTIKSVFDHTFWPMLGEFGPMLEFVESSVSPTNAAYNTQLEPFFSNLRVIFSCLLFVIFIFCTNVILLNLLIAMYSFTFNKIQASSTLVYKYQRYELQIEHRSRNLAVPPPLSGLVLILRAIRAIVKACVNCLRCAKKGPSRDYNLEDEKRALRWQLGIKQDMVYRLELEAEKKQSEK